MVDAITAAEMRQSEEQALSSGWTESRLLETAGTSLGQTIAHLYPQCGTAIAYLGKGHNAGDALVALQRLREQHGWQIAYRASHALEDCAPLVQEHAARLGPDAALQWTPEWDECQRPLILLDGLLGTGSKGTLRPPLQESVAEMEWLRDNVGAHILSVDLPSGVHPDEGNVGEGAVTADFTLMIGNPKIGLLRSRAGTHTGALALVPVPALQRKGTNQLELIAPQSMAIGKRPRAHDSHKGTAGRVRILAGSSTYPGAAALAAQGALRGGAGLVYLHVPNSALDVVRMLCPPEVIVAGYDHLREVPLGKADARVVGCGLGAVGDVAWVTLEKWIVESDIPTVVDADALNAIASHQARRLLRSHHVLTPHPGEFQRLAPDLSELPRQEAARAFIKRHPSALLLKGQRSLIAYRGQPLRCNSTGHAGMASGGQGDVLAGVVGARLAAGDEPFDAASLAAWLCGRAAERSVQSHPPQSAETMTASDTLAHLGGAWRDWRQSTR